MKKIFQLSLCVLIIFSAMNVSAQATIIAKKTKNALLQNKAVHFDLFTQVEAKNTQIEAAINNVVYLKMDKSLLSKIYQNKYATISFSLPIDGKLETVLLSKYNIFSSDFEAQTKGSNGQYETANQPEGLFYRGYIQSDERSMAAISFYTKDMGGVLSIATSKGNFNLVADKQNANFNNEQYLLFNEADVINGADYMPICKNESIQDIAKLQAKTGNRTAAKDQGASCQVVTIALYGDYKLYLKNQSNLANTQNYLTTLFNGVAAVYENEQIRVALKQLNVNVVNDNYPGTADGVLKKFGNEINTNITANLMQFVTGHSVAVQGGGQYAPLGGLAWLNVLCMSPYYYSSYESYVGPYSMINTMGNPNIPLVPIYSWDVNCSAHEFGHNLGSPHTHSCSWNGNGTAIDGCAGIYSSQYIDPNCALPGVPSNQGTMMSYCHLLQNVGVNFVNGFGPQPGDTIRARVNEAVAYGCLSTDYMPEQLLAQSNTTLIADGFCYNGDTLYCYNTNNDFDRLNDELILIIVSNNINSLNLSSLEISTTTNQSFASNQAVDASTYAYNTNAQAWYHGNRSWSINLNQSLAGNTKYIFPYLSQDKQDLTGAWSPMNNLNDSMYMIAYKTAAAAQSPDIASANDVQIFKLGTGASNWSNVNKTNYSTATIQMSNTLYGLNFATGRLIAGVGILNKGLEKQLKLYPNPTEHQLTLDLQIDNKAIESVIVLDYLGRKMIELSKFTNGQSIDVKHLPAGAYWIKCITTSGTYINKFVKL